MILVAVGASQFAFDRLLRAVDGLAGSEQLVVQHGTSEIRPRDAHCASFLPLHHLAALVSEARVVVTHAGVGSILLSLMNGKRPFVVPRLSAFGETVDDHQVESARRFAQAGLVHLVEDPDRLPDALALADGPAHEVPFGSEETPQLVRELRDFLRTTVGEAGEPR